ncbi:MAG: ComF family protein [Actinomycetes bacterium]
MFDYTGPVADAIVAAKRVDAPPVWPALARHLAALLRAVPGPTSPDVVTWVPSRSDAVRARGVDHARVLGRAAGAALGLPALPLLAAAPGRPDQAARTGPVRRQVRPDDLVPVVPVAGARVLLVDDVLTTGATLGLAAWVLRRAGAASVEASVLARAGAHTLGFRWAAPPTSPLPGAHR